MRVVLGVALFLLLWSGKPANATEWYVSHVGAEPCVPLSDIGPHFERLYYGTGDLHTPEDFIDQMMTSYTLATPYKLPPNVSRYAVAYRISVGPHVIFVVLFNDPDACQLFMSQLKP